MVVGPTNWKPCAFSALEMAVDVSVAAGTVLVERCRLISGRPSRCPHNNAASEVRLRSCKSARALAIAASILLLLRTMPASAISRATSRAP